MIVKSVHIQKFRSFNDMSFSLGKKVTAIAGRNGTQKTTVLGMIGQPFTISQKSHPLFGEKTLDGYDFKSQFGEKFKFSGNEQAGNHIWTLNLYDGIYSYKGASKLHFTSESIVRDQKSGKLRIWNAEDKSRKAGGGYIQAPVYYLSLSRLYPIGEAGKTTALDMNLTDAETDYCLFNYKEILTILDVGEEPSVGVEKKSKQGFAGINDSKHDVSTNSAGEGNISKILLAMLSFRRLKEKHGNDYKGGILLIDELDAAVYPRSQKKLVKYLLREAGEYSVQVVFTTHSPIVLQALNEFQIKERKGKGIEINSTAYDSAIVYLEPDQVEIGQITASNINSVRELRRCINDMDLTTTLPETQLHVYFEDSVAASLAKFLLEKNGIDYGNFFDFQELSLGWTQYVTLLSKKAFRVSDCLILLDADVPYDLAYHTHKGILENSENVIFLPMVVEPGLFKLLRHADNFAIFHKDFSGNTSFTREICFRDWPQEYEHYEKNNKQAFKDWFHYVEQVVGRDILYEFWLSRNADAAASFINRFCVAYNKLADRLTLDPLPCNVEDSEETAPIPAPLPPNPPR